MKHWIVTSAFLLLATQSTANTLDQTRLKTFVDAQVALKDDIAKQCADGQSPSLDPLIESAKAWMAVQALQLPAAGFLQTEHRFIFWPDPKDRLKRQVITAIKTSPEDIEWEDLPSSVGSLSAIELLLTNPDAATHCAWLNSIARYQIEQTEQLASLQEFYSFGTAERLTSLHGSALTLHAILNAVVGREDRTLWVLAPAWRSEAGPAIGNTLIQQTIELMRLFADRDPDLTPIIEQWQSQKRLSAESTYDEISTWNEDADALAAYVEEVLAPKLGLFLGFNNFDGD